jgi:hypothetical protein
MTHSLVTPALLCAIALSAAPAAVQAQVLASRGTAERLPALTLASTQTQSSSQSRDGLKNGAIIGAVIGGVSMLALGAVGCGMTAGFSGNDSGCGAGMALLTGLGVGLGAGIGVGVDALLERSPIPRAGTGGRQLAMRVRMRF